MIEVKNCLRCGNEFSVHADPILGNIFTFRRKLCDPCAEIEAGEIKRKETLSEQEKREDLWGETCPPIYRNTDFTHEGLNPSFREAVMAWEPFSERGLGFMGYSGSGKTRLLFCALRKGFDADLGIRYITHNGFSKLVIDAFSSGHSESRDEARRALDGLSKVRVLLLDDLGKAPSTERCDAEMEELIEIRGSKLIPTLWSANGHGEWLIKRFGADRGEPLVRRLAEFSTVIKS